MEVWSCPTIPTLQRPWWWRWVSIEGEEEWRRKRELCSSVFSALLHYLFYAFFSFFFAVVGTTIGAMTGAVFGMKSERKIGLVHGAAVGAFTGASFFLRAINASFAFWISFHDDEPPSFPLFIEVITSLLKPTLVYLGEEFGPGMHGPVRNPVTTVEPNNQVPRFIDRKGGNALRRGSILDKLPKTRITNKNMYDSSGNRISCSVCLEHSTMVQVMAARAIHSSLACPNFGSLQNQVDKIKPFGFASKVLACEPQNSHRVFRISSPITAKISAAKVVPIFPDDVKLESLCS